MTTMLSNRELNRATLARQMLLAREKTDAMSAVARLFAMQAQEARPPYIGLWTRLVDFQRDELTRLLLDRMVVRATAMRGTLHMMGTQDYLAIRSTLQPMLAEAMTSILKTRVSSFDLEAVVAEGRRFFGEKPRTFDAFREYLEESHPGGDIRAMAYTVRMHLPLVQVPAEVDWGFPARAEFMPAADWLGKPLPQTPRLETVVRRYLLAFGPASVADAQAWTGMRGLAEAFEAQRSEFVTFRSESGKELFDLPYCTRPPEETPAPVRFLPEFDNLLLAHADRRRIIADEYRKRVVTANLRVLPTFLVDGFVAGTWRLETKKKSATLIIEPFEPIAAGVKEELAGEGEKLLGFVSPDASPVVEFT